jgi:ABC-2 type transport system permease protein
MTKRIWTVAHREVRGYFDQPTAYVLIVAFLGLSLFLTYRTMYAMGVASLRPLFDLLPILLAIFVPAATMRSLAEERRSRTLEWLLAQPVTETEVLVGKFLGDWIFVMLALAGTVPTAIGVLMVSEADSGIIVAQYLGASLLAAQFVAIGLWASSFTRNQITAFIVAAAVSFALILIGLPIVQIGLPPVLSGAVARLSVLSHFENVARGVVDLRDVVYFVSTSALFVFMALGAVLRDRLSHGRPEWLRLRVGVAVFAALVVMINLLGSYMRGRIDLTAARLYTLEAGTRELLRDLDDIVQVKLFASTELPPELQLQLRDVRDLLADMRAAAQGKLIVSVVDPDRAEGAAAEAEDLGIFPVEFNVLRDDEFQVRRGYYGLAVVYADQSSVTPVIQRTDDLEFRLASAIYNMTATDRVRIAYVQGFGAGRLGDVPGLMQSLGDRYDMRALDLSGGMAPPGLSPDSLRVLVVAGPTEPLDSVAVQSVRDFVDGGGSALLMLEPVNLDDEQPVAIPNSSGLEPMLQERGVTVTGRLVLDLASSERVNVGRQGIFQVIAPYPLWPIARPASGHAITSGLNTLTMGWAGELEIRDSATVEPLWSTSDAGSLHALGGSILPNQDWSVPQSELGRRILAVAVTPIEDDPRGRLVVVGDASFMEAQFVQANPGNLSFLANAIDWLAQEEALIRIRSKDRAPPNLVFESDMGRNVLKWGNLVGVPLLFVLFGMVRVTGRKRRAEARWKEVVA